MAPNANGNMIAKTWHEPAAQTGESTRYQTVDGRVWRETTYGAVVSNGEHGWISKDGRVTR